MDDFDITNILDSIATKYIKDDNNFIQTIDIIDVINILVLISLNVIDATESVVLI